MLTLKVAPKSQTTSKEPNKKCPYLLCSPFAVFICEMHQLSPCKIIQKKKKKN